MHFFNRILEALLLPPFGPLLWIVAGLVLSNWRPRLGRLLSWTGVLVSLVLMIPATISWLLGPLEAVPVVTPAALQGAGAIVILGGGRRSYAPDFGGETVNRLTLERVRYGARLAKVTRLPVLVSGGVATEEFHSEASLMAESLREDFGVQPRWLEEYSVNTAENARNAAILLRRAGIERIVLVTQAAHMPRARRYFEAEGLTVIPAPTGFQSSPASADDCFNCFNWFDWLPTQNASYAGWYALHEWAGLLQQRLSGLAGR